jgi:hypothetical protein
MIFGGKDRYSVNFKKNQPSFDIYTRKYMHNLKILVDDRLFEGCKALEIISSRLLLVTKIDKVIMFDIDSLKECG